jgi:hypothetical protein
LSTLHEQAVIPVADQQRFQAVRSAVETAFSANKVREFLRTLERSSLRIRDFERVLSKGALGVNTAAEYGGLPASDQGQIRELYLATLEKVTPDLRAEFFKLYSYY